MEAVITLSLELAGNELACAIFNGDSSLLQGYVADLDSGDKKTGAIASEVLTSMGYALALIFENISANGTTFSPALPSASRLFYLRSVSKDRFFSNEGVWALTSAVTAYRKIVPNARVSCNQSKVQAEPPKPEEKKPENPVPVIQKIEIVGMPVRETVVTVERDPDGEIARTTQRETDA